MEADLQKLLTLIQQKSPSLYPLICDQDVIDYLENGEFGLAFELLTFNAEGFIEQLTEDVVFAITHILKTYDMHEFSKDLKIRARYDKFLRLAKAGFDQRR